MTNLLIVPPGDSTTVTGFAFTVLEPTIDRLKVYCTGFLPVLAGMLTVSLTFPLEHGVDMSRPDTALFEVNVQDVALVTLADKVTVPPFAVSVEGLAENDETVGAGTVKWMKFAGHTEEPVVMWICAVYPPSRSPYPESGK
jgi:hypothetical protein